MLSSGVTSSASPLATGISGSGVRGPQAFLPNLPHLSRPISGTGDSGGVSTSSSHVLVPTAGEGGGSSGPSPHARAFELLSTPLAVLAVGAYVYTLLTRKAKGGKDGKDPAAATATPPALPGAAQQRPAGGAGTGLFRPAGVPGTLHAGPTAPGAVRPEDSSLAAVGPLPGAMAPAGTAPPPPLPGSDSLRPAAGPAAPSAARPQGWWKRLGKLYYISFGAQFGLVPRIRLPGPSSGEGGAGGLPGAPGFGGGAGGARERGSPCLAAFEDPADAEYVAAVLWEDLVSSGAVPDGPRPGNMGVLSAVPMFLEDLAAMRGAAVEVVPSDSLRKDVLLSAKQLEVVLAALLQGASPEAAAARAQQLVEREAAAAARGAPSPAQAQAGAGPAERLAPSAGQPGGASSGPAGGGADPLGRVTSRKGLKLKLPSKFDFPGFDPPSKPAGVAAPSAAAATPEARTAPEPLSLVEVPAPAPAPGVAGTGTRPSTSGGGAGTPSPAAAPAAAKPVAAAPPQQETPGSPPPLPQIVPSAVHEPRDGDGDLPSTATASRGYLGTYGRVVDVAVEPAAATGAGAGAAAGAGAEAPPAGLSAPPPSAQPSSSSAASADGGQADVTPTLDEALREYRELEALLAEAVSAGGAAAGPGGGGDYDGGGGSGGGARALTVDVPAAETSVSGPLDVAAVAELRGQEREEEQGQGRRQDDEGASRQQQKTAAEVARGILESRGPTDSAIDEALSALEAEERAAREDDLLDEYYSIFNTTSTSTSTSSATSGTSTSSGARRSGGSGGGAPASRAGLAAEVAEVQSRLAEVIQEVAAAQARGVPPPRDAAARMQGLQRQLTELQKRLTAAETETAPQPQPQPPRAEAAATGSRKGDSTTVRGAAPASGAASSAAAAAAASANLPPGTGLFSSLGPPLPPLETIREQAARDAAAAAAAAGRGGTAATLDPASLVTPLPSSAGAGGAAAADAKAGARRAWGAWKSNRRIQAAEATLLKGMTSASPPSPPPPNPPARQAPGASERAASAAASPASAAGPAAAAGRSSEEEEEEEDGVTVVSKRVGSGRAPKVVESPEMRHDRVKEALRAFAEMNASSGDGGGGEGAGGGEDSDEADGGELAAAYGGGSGLRRAPWWQRRFQVLFLPTIGYPDGAIGFMQVNVSLNPDRRDMRVLAFEDRTDCTACVALLARWPDYQGTEPRVSMMPTSSLLGQLVDMYDEQSDLNLNPGVSRPRGLAVFRRGKLPLRPGLGPEEVLQLAVYQHAAQRALARTGFEFNN